MVYYFTSTAVEPSAYVYMGKDKFENEELLKYGWEEDVWFVHTMTCFFMRSYSLTLIRFHVENLSSAHVYLRLPDGESWDSINPNLLVDLAQLTKDNSIQGRKKNVVTIIYTPWSNVKKDGSMDVGQVSFKDPRKVKHIEKVESKSEIVKRLEKTKVEKKPDLHQEREDRLRQLRKRDQAARQERKREEARIAQEHQEKKWQKDHAYDDVFTEQNMESSSNQNRDADWEDDFM